MKKFILLVCLFATTAAIAQTTPPIKISDANIRYRGEKWGWVFNIKNISKERIKGKTCIRFNDKDSFEVGIYSLAGSFNLAPNAAEKISETSLMDPKEAIQVTSIKMYSAAFGCADSPSEALSNRVVPRAKPNNFNDF